MPEFRVVITDLGYRTYRYEKEQLERIGAEVILAESRNEDDVIKHAKDADGLIVRMAPITAKVIRSLDKCRIISRYGVGADNVDILAATEKGIMVANVPDYCEEEVSDHALALFMACTRKIVSHDKQIREGAWDIGAADPIYRLARKVFGLIGYGKIARTLHRKLIGFKFSRILVSDPYLDRNTAVEHNIELVDLSSLLKESDYISIHAPLTDKTHHMIGSKEFKIMKHTAIIINTSRGPIIDQEALYRALKEGWINSAGIDVYENEPVEKNCPLFELDNIVVTDHASWYSEDSQVELQTKAAINVVQALSGQPVTNLVNKKTAYTDT
jgi:D-3-phosphoglycerate dehydrogenase